MRILVITQNYPPDLGAGSFRMKALVEVLIKRNHEVVVITGTPNRYDSIKEEFSEDESSREKIIRISVPRQKQDLIQRGLSYFGFFFKASIKAKRMARSCDVVVATSPQLLVAYSGAIAARRAKKPFVLDIRDLWPDVMIDLNLASEKSRLYKILKRIEANCYEQASAIVINSPAFEAHIEEMSKKKSTIITNGIDDELFDTLRQTARKVPKKPFTITYAGNLGIAQDLEVLLKAAGKCNGNYRFRLIGDGSERAKLESIIKELRVDNIELIGPVPRSKLTRFYEETDAFFVHLKNIDMFKKTVPSKIFEYVATGKPIIFGLKGVAREIMLELQTERLAFEPGDESSLLEALNRLNDEFASAECSYRSENSGILRDKYLRSTLSNRFADVIEESAK